MPKGNGDKSLTLFGEDVTPNLHKLADEFILYDNFYVNADVSAEGHNWASAAIAPDYTVKMWPNSYAGRRKTYDYEGGEPANNPPAGFIWTNAISAGISVRTYGIWTANAPLKSVQNGRQIAHVRDPALAPFTDMNFRGFDLDYPDVDRANEFLREWKEFDEKGTAPQLIVMRIPNDHTSGLSLGKDFAAIRCRRQRLRHGHDCRPCFPQQVVGIHRHLCGGRRRAEWSRSCGCSPFSGVCAFALYAVGKVDSEMYNRQRFCGLGLLGLRPMTQFDAASRTMFGSFSTKPDLTPFVAEKPRTSLTQRNTTDGPEAKRSKQWTSKRPTASTMTV